MSDQEPEAIAEVSPDLAYDLAHEMSEVATPADPDGPGEREAVVTATPEYDGDYSYDLAHDVPRQ